MPLIRSRLICLVPLSVILGCVVAPARADTSVFSQAARFPGTTSFYSWTSSSDSLFVTSDNFTVTNSSSLTGITWQGLTFNVNNFTTGVEPATFNIEFRADNGGTPGTVLDNEMVTHTKTLAGTLNFFGSQQQQNIYNYTTTLSGVFTATANTPLWVSVIGNPTSPDYWTWTEGAGSDNSSYQEITGGSSVARPGDRAFTLMGVPAPGPAVVPEPSSIASMGLGGVGLLGLLLRARKRRTAA